jgi:hypothetical protein
MTDPAVGWIKNLIRSGALIPVQVFGTNECCEHGSMGAGQDCPSTGFGLCDRFSSHAPGGSDCNRAEFFLLRPSNEVMADPSIRAALEEVIDEDDKEVEARRSTVLPESTKADALSRD